MKALDESIEHWKRMQGFTTPKEFDKENPGGDHCPLCNWYTDCYSGCPVYEHTKARDCHNTPWLSASYSYERYLIHPTNGNLIRFRKAAQAEIDFLEGLKNDI